MIVAVASRKASPGVTTLTALLAGFWTEDEAIKVIIEADASGGTLAARWSRAHDISWDPGLLAMSATRGELDRETLPAVTQRVSDDVLVAAAPPASGQIAAALSALGERGATSLAAAPGVRAFVDCGRLHSTSLSIGLARRAAVTLVMCRPVLEDVYAVQPAIDDLTQAGCAVGLICVGSGEYDPLEIAAICETDLVGVLPNDERGANALNTDGFAAGRVFHRSPLAKRMVDLTSHIQARCAEVMVPNAAAHERAASEATDDDGPRRTGNAAPVGFAALVQASNTGAPEAVGNHDAAMRNGFSANGSAPSNHQVT